MKRILSPVWIRAAVAANCLLVAAVIFAADPLTQIDIQSKTLFPESITSLKDGTLIVGSSSEGNIYKIAPGKTQPELWIKSGTGGMEGTVLGVLADEMYGNLWVCAQGQKALRSFDLKTGAPKGNYPLPEGGQTCNDIAVRLNGQAFIADTGGAQIYTLKPGAKALELVVKNDLLAGADGLCFLEDQAILYVNSVTTSKLVRVILKGDGSFYNLSEVKLSKPIQGPDGMRPLDRYRILLAENKGGKMDIITISKIDQTVSEGAVATIKDGLAGTPAVTYTKGMAWIIEGKFDMRPKGKDATPAPDPSPFRMWAVPVQLQ